MSKEKLCVDVVISKGKSTMVMAIASPIFTPPGSFAPKKGAIATIGAMRMRPKKKRVMTAAGSSLELLKKIER